MANIDLALAALGVALAMITWGLDKMHYFERHPRFGNRVGKIYVLVGLFWLFITVYAAFR